MKPVEELRDVAEHGQDCVRRGLIRGRPTADGGYECFYRVPDGTRWFRTRPVDETPKCDCGLEAWLARYGPLLEAAVECEELWSGDYRNARNPGEIQRRLNEARAKVAAAYRAAKGGGG